MASALGFGDEVVVGGVASRVGKKQTKDPLRQSVHEAFGEDRWKDLNEEWAKEGLIIGAKENDVVPSRMSPAADQLIGGTPLPSPPPSPLRKPPAAEPLIGGSPLPSPPPSPLRKPPAAEPLIGGSPLPSPPPFVPSTPPSTVVSNTELASTKGNKQNAANWPLRIVLLLLFCIAIYGTMAGIAHIKPGSDLIRMMTNGEVAFGKLHAQIAFFTSIDIVTGAFVLWLVNAVSKAP